MPWGHLLWRTQYASPDKVASGGGNRQGFPRRLLLGQISKPTSSSTCFHSLAVRQAFFAILVPLVGSCLQIFLSSTDGPVGIVVPPSFVCCGAAAPSCAAALAVWLDGAGAAAIVAIDTVVTRTNLNISDLPLWARKSYICSALFCYPPAVRWPTREAA